MTLKETVEEAFGLSLNKRMSNLSVAEIFTGIFKLEKEGYGDAQNKSISIFIGATRSGKSTTTNLFLNNALVVKKDDDPNVPLLNRQIILVEKNNSEGRFPTIGTKTTSETTIPMKYSLNDGDIWDCPGFGDSRGPQQEIINAWFLNRLFKTSQGVKLFNVCSAISFIQNSNVSEFRGYIKQIIDLFEEQQLAELEQTLIFTKTEKDHSVEDLKEACMHLIKEHFPDQNKLYDFFINARATKIDKVKNEDIGRVLTGKDIPDLNKAYMEMKYQQLQPHIAVDSAAQTFLYKSITDLCKVASDNIKRACQEAYTKEIKKQLENTFKRDCTSKNFIKLSEEFMATKQKIFEIAYNNPTILKEIKLLREITDFVLQIIPENNNLREMVETNIEAIQCYNIAAIDYNITVEFLSFLKANTSNITDKKQFHKGWEEQIENLEKPKIGDLSGNLSQLQEKSVKANKEISRLHEQGLLEAEKKLTARYREELEEMKRDCREKLHEYQEKMINSVNPTFWAVVPVIGTVIDKVVKTLKVGNMIRESEEFFTSNIPIPEIQQINTRLDKTLTKYFEENNHSLLGDMSEYWNDSSN